MINVENKFLYYKLYLILFKYFYEKKRKSCCFQVLLIQLLEGTRTLYVELYPLFDKIYVAIGQNANKKYMFPLDKDCNGYRLFLKIFLQ